MSYTVCESSTMAEATTPRALALRLRALQRAERDFAGATARSLGLGAIDLLALTDLFEAGPLGPTELGRRLGIGSAAASGLADRLEAAGHVRRESHPDDRRRLVLVPTDHARAEVLEHVAPVARAIEARAAALDPAERETVARFLDAVLAAYGP